MIARLFEWLSGPRLVRVACYLGVIALLLMIWSVLDASALPVVIGMSVGQGLGILAFACFLVAVLRDTRSKPGPS